MRPQLDFKVLDWADATGVLKVRIYGSNQHGEVVDEVVVFHQPVEIRVVHALVAKMNNNNYR